MGKTLQTQNTSEYTQFSLKKKIITFRCANRYHKHHKYHKYRYRELCMENHIRDNAKINRKS